MSMPQQSQTTSRTTWTNASTRSVDVSGTKYVYRQLGADSDVPVIFLNHLAAELDRWDPRIVDASRRHVIAFDNRGVGASEGSTPNSVAAMAQDAVAFIRALGLKQVDVSASRSEALFRRDAQEEQLLVRNSDPRRHRAGRGHGHRQRHVDHPPRHDQGRADAQTPRILSLLH